MLASQLAVLAGPGTDAWHQAPDLTFVSHSLCSVMDLSPMDLSLELGAGFQAQHRSTCECGPPRWLPGHQAREG